MTDEEAIRQLLARYCQLADDGRYDDWSRLFTPDGTFKPGSGEPVSGRAALVANLERSLGSRPERRTKHVCANSIIDVQGDEATAVSDYLVFHRTGDQPWSCSTSGRQHDRLVKVDGRWLFAERRNMSDARS
jgi:uncharacterized protein (TIGR02246 family)